MVYTKAGNKFGSDAVDFLDDHGEIKVRKAVAKSAFHRYRGALKELQGSDPDELVGRIRGH